MAAERERSARVWFFRTWTLIGALLLLYALWEVLDEPLAIVVPPLALAAVIVYLLNPFVRALAARGVPRVLGTAIAYLVLLGAVAAGLSFLVPVIVDQVATLAEAFPEMALELQATLNRQLAQLGLDLRVNLDLGSAEVREAVRQYLVGGRTEQVGEILSGAGDVARSVLHAAVIVLLGPVLAFYLLADLPDVQAGLKRLVPPGHRREVTEVVEGIMGRVGGYFRGQLLVATFVGVATALGLAVVGLPFWALIGLVTGIFNLVPLIGPFVGGAIGVVVALTVGDGFTQAIWVVVVMTVVQQIDNHVISPNVMSRTVELHPITVMLGLLVAGSLYGILGMLIAVPVIAAVKLVVLHVLSQRLPWVVGEDQRPDGERPRPDGAQGAGEEPDPAGAPRDDVRTAP